MVACFGLPASAGGCPDDACAWCALAIVAGVGMVLPVVVAAGGASASVPGVSAGAVEVADAVGADCEVDGDGELGTAAVCTVNFHEVASLPIVRLTV